jgi:hypothetical protein
VPWIATACATVFETLASSCKVTTNKRYFFLEEINFLSSVFRRTATGAFSDPAVRLLLLYQPAGCHNGEISCSPEALQYTTQRCPITGRCLS